MDSSCPLPQDPTDCITMAHGGGGRLTQRLLDELFLPAFASLAAAECHDSWVRPPSDQPLAFTTDSHVVQPLFFPGGDIGKLAVCGTVNDLAMAGARPDSLAVGFILEEGLPLQTLHRVVLSMAETAREAGVRIVAGDTKVVERTKADGLYLTTSGIGTVLAPRPLHPSRIQPGDTVLLSGPVGQHGMAIMAEREGLAFDSPIQSDCAPLHGAVLALLEAGIPLHCLRDCTRGGLATALVELARQSTQTILLREEAVPVPESVHAACELLGIDPLYVANEGTFVALLPATDADKARQILLQKGFPQARIVGTVQPPPEKTSRGQLLLQNPFGLTRSLDLISGEQLPRIC